MTTLNSPLALIYPYLKASERKSHVDRKRKTGNYAVLTNLPEKQSLKEEEIPKVCQKLSKKRGKRLFIRRNKFFSYGLESSDKSENFLLYDGSGISIKEDTQSQVVTLSDIIKDFILRKLCSKKQESPLFCKNSKQE